MAGPVLQLQNFASLVASSVAAAQSACTSLTNMTTGSVSRALLEANATIGLWVQWLNLQVLSLTRASTSVGPNLDSWMADFSFPRLGANQASGTLGLYRYVTGQQVFVYAPTTGTLTQVKTADGTQTFTVLPDTANTTGFWSTANGCYLMPANASTINVLIQAVNSGTQGNVNAGTINQLAASIPGIDYCLNALAFINGLNAETDASFRTRFPLYLQSFRQGTPAALLYAVTSVSQGITAVLQPGAPYTGSTTAYIDDGSGATPSATIQAVAAALQTVRAEGTSTYALQAPVTGAAINVVFVSASGYTHANQIGPVNTAIAAFISAIPVGQTLQYAQLASTVFNATPGIVSVPTLQVNGGQSDLPPSVPYGVVRASSIVVS